MTNNEAHTKAKAIVLDIFNYAYKKLPNGPLFGDTVGYNVNYLLLEKFLSEWSRKAVLKVLRNKKNK